jgi:hypothetical protein
MLDDAPGMIDSLIAKGILATSTATAAPLAGISFETAQFVRRLQKLNFSQAAETSSGGFLFSENS